MVRPWRFILNLSSNKYANYHGLKHAGLSSPSYWCRSNVTMFCEALMSLSMQHNLHSLVLQRITLRILDSLASGSKTPFFFQRIRFRYNTTGLRHKEHVWLVLYSSMSTTLQYLRSSRFNRLTGAVGCFFTKPCCCDQSPKPTNVFTFLPPPMRSHIFAKVALLLQ